MCTTSSGRDKVGTYVSFQSCALSCDGEDDGGDCVQIYIIYNHYKTN